MDLAHTRNRIRHELLPLIRRTINPSASDALVRLGLQSRRASEAIAAWAALALAQTSRVWSDAEVVLDVSALTDLPAAVQSELIRQAIEQVRLPRQSTGFERIEAGLRLLKGDGRKRIVEVAGGGIERRGNALRFFRTRTVRKQKKAVRARAAPRR
jgi:tRNA(Ile)-lysidine synthase